VFLLFFCFLFNNYFQTWEIQIILNVEAMDAWRDLEDEDDVSARQIKRKALASSSYDMVEVMIERHMAKKANVSQKGFKHFTQEQWEDRMCSRGATVKEAAACWNNSTDRSGNKHPKVCPEHGEPYIKWKMPKKEIEEHRKEKELVSRGRDRKFSTADAEAILGTGQFTTPKPSRRGKRARSPSLRRSNAHENLDDLDAGEDFEHSDVEARDAWLSNSGGGMLMDGEREPTSGTKEGGDDGSDEENTSIEKWTPPPSILKKTIEELQKMLLDKREGMVIKKTAKVWTKGSVLRRYVDLLMARDWEVIR